MRAASLVLMALSIICAASPGRAGDTAELGVIGFSGDGSVFVFEEFGIQDGSGFPYANRFYIDTMTDRFLPGSPVRVRIDDEGATIEAARAQAADRGASILPDTALVPGHAAGRNAITEISADAHAMTVNPRPVFPPIDTPLHFVLEEKPLEQPEICTDLGDTVGFRLAVVGLAEGGSVRVINDDASIPQSRGCPLGYMIGGVQTFFPEGAAPVFAVLVAMRAFGFEGPDHRWLAVTGRIGN